MVTLKGSLIPLKAGLTAETRRTRRLLFYYFPLRGRKTIITSHMATQPSYPNLRYYMPSYCLIYHYGVDLFFSGLSAEKKKFFSLRLESRRWRDEKHSLTYPPNKAGTISIAEGLRAN